MISQISHISMSQQVRADLGYRHIPRARCWRRVCAHADRRSVLHAIKLRYNHKEIYTYSGIVLIATNPFARVDSLYVPGMVQVYAGKQRSTQAPHLFAIAEEAFSYGTRLAVA